MSILPIVVIPDPILRKPSKPVERVDDSLRKFADNMLETMYDAPGVGLAAIQVAEPIRMLTVDVSEKEEERQPQVFVNPKIVEVSDTPNVYEEKGRLDQPQRSGRASWSHPVIASGKLFLRDMDKLLAYDIRAN